MKFHLLLPLCFFTMMPLMAQTDPVIMTVNGHDVTRSEFEYSFNKNNTEGVIDKKTVNEYVELFVNYKLKVEAAKEARLDTMKSFKDEFTSYRDQQIRPSFINDDDVEAEAQRIYQETKQRIDSAGGMVKPAHILLLVRQSDDQAKHEAAKQRIDSIYQALKAGADFAELATRLSDDKGSARNGGELPWLTKGQTLPEFETAAFALNKGEMSEPVLSAAGYHVILMKDKGLFFPYDSVKADIHRFIDQRGLREKIIDDKLATLVKEADNGTTAEQLLDKKADEMAAEDLELKYLIQEYHDGLLLYEISNKHVWKKAEQDTEGLERYFKKNKKKYAWDEPRFKGMAYHVKEQADVKAVQQAVKGLPFSKWAEKLRSTFNNDSILRIRVEKGIFKCGDNALVDREVFKKDTTVTPTKNYPIDATYGKLLKAPEECDDVRGLVLADYQEQLEREWVAELRKRYIVSVDEEVLKTVNQH